MRQQCCQAVAGRCDDSCGLGAVAALHSPHVSCGAKSHRPGGVNRCLFCRVRVQIILQNHDDSVNVRSFVISIYPHIMVTIAMVSETG